jgi:hypothetical protein
LTWLHGSEKVLHEVPDFVRRVVHSPGALLACSFAGAAFVSAGLAPSTAVSAARDDPGSVARALAGCAVSPGQVVQWPAPRLRSAAVSARGYNAVRWRICWSMFPPTRKASIFAKASR